LETRERLTIEASHAHAISCHKDSRIIILLHPCRNAVVHQRSSG
jgi:hypothetical protein